MNKYIKQLEADGFTDVRLVRGRGCTQWFTAIAPPGRSPNPPDPVVMLRIGSAWHCFYCSFRGAGSGYTPLAALRGCLGDVIGTDSQLRSYKKVVLNAPAWLSRSYDGLYAAQVQAYRVGW